MGQDKKQLTKLLAFVKELYDHPDNGENNIDGFGIRLYRQIENITRRLSKDEALNSVF